MKLCWYWRDYDRASEATQHLWQAAEAYGQTVEGRTPQQWFQRLRHQLRQGSVHHSVKAWGRLLQYQSTPDAAKPTLKRVQH